jgi:hypothetical protein
MILIRLEQNSTAHELNEMQNSNADTNKALCKLRKRGEQRHAHKRSTISPIMIP